MATLARAWQLLSRAGKEEAADEIAELGKKTLGDEEFGTAMNEAIFTS
jgi:hypothetical protein